MDDQQFSLSLDSDDPAVGLRAVGALHRLAEVTEARYVALARERGWTWEQIGDALGVSRQSVHVKHGKAR
ncbi:helix-turn-helix domain-containing protein [Sinomonas sp. B1-1]|uniref:helix-turn-helix domain-containing protein n=1 Tax=Sinomonas sp. B1-1 TaxID=3141454 RepID=UPI003D2A70E9